MTEHGATVQAQLSSVERRCTEDFYFSATGFALKRASLSVSFKLERLIVCLPIAMRQGVPSRSSLLASGCLSSQW
jgi:hypothetical protein